MKNEEGKSEGSEEMGGIIEKLEEFFGDAEKTAAEHDEAKSAVLNQQVAGVDGKNLQKMENSGVAQGVGPTSATQIINYVLAFAHAKETLDVLLPEVEAYVNATANLSTRYAFLDLLLSSDAAKTDSRTDEVSIDPKR